MSLSLDEFTARLSASGVLSQDAVRGFLGSLPADTRPTTAAALTAALIQAGKLTTYQAETLLSDKPHPLVLDKEYVILDRIGAGGMGEVFRARHRRMDRVVAIKMLPAKTVDSPEAVARFHREVKAASRLNHPNIVQVYDARVDQGIHFYVMEYVEGSDLSSLVKSRGALPISQPRTTIATSFAAVGRQSCRQVSGSRNRIVVAFSTTHVNRRSGGNGDRPAIR